MLNILSSLIFNIFFRLSRLIRPTPDCFRPQKYAFLFGVNKKQRRVSCRYTPFVFYDEMTTEGQIISMLLFTNSVRASPFSRPLASRARSVSWWTSCFCLSASASLSTCSMSGWLTFTTRL